MKILSKIFKTLIVIVVAMSFLVLPFTGCVELLDFLQYAGVWACDYGDIKIEIVTTGFVYDAPLGTMTIDGHTTDIAVLGNSISGTLIYDQKDIEIPFKDFPEDQNEPQYILKCKYKSTSKNLYLEITEDNTNREGKESLVGKKLVLTRYDIPIPQEID